VPPENIMDTSLDEYQSILPVLTYAASGHIDHIIAEHKSIFSIPFNEQKMEIGRYYDNKPKYVVHLIEEYLSCTKKLVILICNDTKLLGYMIVLQYIIRRVFNRCNNLMPSNKVLSIASGFYNPKIVLEIPKTYIKNKNVAKLPQTVRELAEMAKKYVCPSESTMKQRFQQTQNSSQHQIHYHNLLVEPSLTTYNRKRKYPHYKESKQFNTSPPFCYYCQSRDHSQIYCPYSKEYDYGRDERYVFYPDSRY
jgi:hypothetical protein